MNRQDNGLSGKGGADREKKRAEKRRRVLSGRHCFLFHFVIVPGFTDLFFAREGRAFLLRLER